MALVDHEVDPISRIEGHLGVKLTVDDATGRVVSADAHGNLWRGFENFLIGRAPNDAITFVQRICGVCPVPHGLTATYAVDAAYGYSGNMQTFSDIDNDGKGVPSKAVHIRNLILSAEFLMSSITHFYHLAAPSYVQGPNIPPWTPYFDDSYYHPYLRSAGKGTGDLTGEGAAGFGSAGSTMPALAADGFSADVWSAVIRSYVKALRIRRLTFEASALFAGRAPMVSAYVAGGVTNDTKSNIANFQARCDQYKTLMKEVGTFIVQQYVPIVLALGALYPNYDNLANATVLNTYYPALWTAGNQVAAGAPSTNNTGFGAGLGNYLSWGAFPDPASQTLAVPGAYKVGAAATVTFQSGKSTSAGATAFVTNNLVEHIAHSRYADYNNEFGGNAGSAFPGNVSRTKPLRGDANKYSWMKAPRLNVGAGGTPVAFEVGPLARMAVMGVIANGTPLRTSVPGYVSIYTKASTGYSGPAVPDGLAVGLDPAAIDPDIAVALVRAGLAELWLGSTKVASLPATKAEIVAAYVDPSAYIMGTIRNWVVNLSGGLSTMDRLRGRAIESLWLVQQMIGAPTKAAGSISWNGTGWIDALKARPAAEGTYNHKTLNPAGGYGFGGTEAPRGALMHFVSYDNKGVISKYQCVVPTTWNGSPKDSAGNPGAIEKAMENIPFSTVDSHYKKQNGTSGAAKGGVEALRIAQSFDPCIACAVH